MSKSILSIIPIASTQEKKEVLSIEQYLDTLPFEERQLTLRLTRENLKSAIKAINNVDYFKLGNEKSDEFNNQMVFIYNDCIKLLERKERELSYENNNKFSIHNVKRKMEDLLEQLNNII